MDFHGSNGSRLTLRSGMGLPPHFVDDDICGAMIGEHIKVTCIRCGYIWFEAPADREVNLVE